MMGHETFFLVANTEHTTCDIRGDDFLSRPPRFVHYDRESAEREAVRLAMKYPHDNFAVLEAVGTVSVANNGLPRWEP